MSQAKVEEKFVKPAQKQVNPRAGLEVIATWSWEDAARMDRAGEFAREIQDAIEILEAAEG